jgi:hypothetical protein
LAATNLRVSQSLLDELLAKDAPRERAGDR